MSNASMVVIAASSASAAASTAAQQATGSGETNPIATMIWVAVIVFELCLIIRIIYDEYKDGRY